MKKFNWVFALSISVPMAWSVFAQQPVELPAEVRGKVEQWAPSARVIKVDGRTYSLSKDMQVIDAKAALLSSGAVRSGGRVLLMISQGSVTHVVVNPGSGSVMDLPQQ